MNYKNSITNEVISEHCYERLSFEKRIKFHPTPDRITHRLSDDDSGDFLLSAIIAEETGSVVAGAILGGDILGAVIGGLFSDDNDSDSSSNDSSSNDFGGGDFGGGGAEDSW